MTHYDQQESADNAMACSQIEYDKLSLLYAIGCESSTASNNIKTLCAAMDVPYELLQTFAGKPAPINAGIF